MAISFMTWEPDTCGCAIQESQEQGNSDYGVKFSKVLTKCPVHETVLDLELYEVLMTNSDSEQKRKNRLEGYLLTDKSLGLSESFEQEDGTMSRRFIKGVKYEWNFQGVGTARILNINMTGIILDSNIRNTIVAFVTSNFGENKVVIE